MIIDFLVDGLKVSGKKYVAKMCLCSKKKLIQEMAKNGRVFTINGRRIIVITPYQKWGEKTKELYQKNLLYTRKAVKKYIINHKEKYLEKRRELYQRNIEKEREKAKIRYQKRKKIKNNI